MRTSACAESDRNETRLASLEAENAQLRNLLLQAARKPDAVQPRGVESRAALSALIARLRAEADHAAALYQREIAAKAARLADAEELNQQLRASEELNRRILWNTPDCVGVLDLDGRLITMSDNGPRVFGVANFAGLAGHLWAEFWPDAESRLAVSHALVEARCGRATRFQSRLDVGGAATWWDIAVAPIDGEDGRPERILAISRDITELKQNEARQALLMQEMSHRVKNTLALVQAVAAQTLRNASGLKPAAEALGARLIALAQAHDVLIQGAWASADLRGLVDGAVRLHGDGNPGRFVVSGPDVTLNPRLVLTLALVLHELGTNAAKYGALSTSEGHVRIAWETTAEEGEAQWRFTWEESGGPPVAPPTRVGFGSRLIERNLVQGFGGRVSLTYPVTGVVLAIEAPLGAVVG